MSAGTVRPLADDELEEAWRLGRLAFGGSADPPAWVLRPVPGWVRYGAFDARGRLVGKATDLGHEQWWGGRRVPTADVGGVAVVPEARGSGVGRALLTTLLAAARDRGAAVSALFPTVSAVYRALGWEVAGSLVEVDLDTATLPRGVPHGADVRTGEPADLPAVHDLYTQMARAHDGLLTRTGGTFDLAPSDLAPSDLAPSDLAPSDLAPSGRWPDGADGLSLVEEDGRLTGALLYERGTGYGPESRLTAHDLLATTPASARALAGVLAGWASVAPTVRVPLLAGDPMGTVLPLERARPARPDTWMHRPVDVVRAVQARGWPTHVRGRVGFRLLDAAAPWNAGTWTLTVEDGAGALTPASAEPDLWLDVRGFAVLYCASGTGRGVAAAGLAGGSADPVALDLLASGFPAALLDYF